jgi:hypothetical protein
MYYRLEAGQFLVEAGGQDVSQVQVPDLTKGVHAAQPQSAPPTKLRERLSTLLLLGSQAGMTRTTAVG